MFTGIVEAKVPVLRTEKDESGMTLSLYFPQRLARGISRGASVSVSGACLTVRNKRRTRVEFDIVPGTLKKTTLGGLKKGDFVNIERAMKRTSRLGGHIVSGHVSDRAKIADMKQSGKGKRMVVSVLHGMMKYILPEGFVALDGVSLTVAEVRPKQRTFVVNLVPETFRTTTFGERRKGDVLNIEPDILMRAAVQAAKRK